MLGQRISLLNARGICPIKNKSSEIPYYMVLKAEFKRKFMKWHGNSVKLQFHLVVTYSVVGICHLSSKV